MEPVLSSNVDRQEIAKFSALSSRWWDPESEFKPLHDINPLRLDFVDRSASLRGKRVLDVGCGGGILAESMAKKGAQVTGIDAGQDAIAVAQLHGLESGVTVDYMQTTAEAMAERRPQEFDVVTCMEMLEHVPDPALVVGACVRLSKPGGWIFFSTLNRTPKAWLMAVVGAEYLLRMLPRGTHDYRKFIRPAELSRWGREAGMDVRGTMGIHYDPITRQFRLGAGVDVNYILHGRA